MLNAVSAVSPVVFRLFVYTCELNVLIPLHPLPAVNIKTACKFLCLLINPIILNKKKKKVKKRRLFPKVLCMSIFDLLLKAFLTVSH